VRARVSEKIASDLLNVLISIRQTISRPTIWYFPFLYDTCLVHAPSLCHIRSSRAFQKTEESTHSIFLRLILTSFSIHCAHIFSCALLSSRTSSSVVFSIAPLVCINLFGKTVMQWRSLRIFKTELGGQYSDYSYFSLNELIFTAVCIIQVNMKLDLSS
jgi:hypothetical protein